VSLLPTKEQSPSELGIDESDKVESSISIRLLRISLSSWMASPLVEDATDVEVAEEDLQALLPPVTS
jgi:hypothetical protein